jgi:predicted nuclease of predicted toxin-antitoxin system
LFFKLDENVPFILKRILEHFGDHHVDSIFHQNLTGIDDKKLFEHCIKENMILITLDQDSSNPILYPSDRTKGIIILRPKTQGKNAVKTLFEKFLTRISIEEIIGKKVIIYPEEIKIR